MTQSTIDNYARNNAKKINDFTVKNIINGLNWIVTSCLMESNTGNEQHFITSRYKLRKRNEMAYLAQKTGCKRYNKYNNKCITLVGRYCAIKMHCFFSDTSCSVDTEYSRNLATYLCSDCD